MLALESLTDSPHDYDSAPIRVTAIKRYCPRGYPEERKSEIAVTGRVVEQREIDYRGNYHNIVGI